MSSEHSPKIPTFQVAAAILQYTLVKLNGAGKLTPCVATDTKCLGVTQRETFAADEYVSVRPLHDDGTHIVRASGAISSEADVFLAANGEVAATGTKKIGVALEAAGANDDWIEIMPDRTVQEVAGVAGGYRIARGQHTTVAAADTVTTGLATVVSVVASLDDDPVDGVMGVSATIGDQAGTPAAGSVIIKGWRSTDADATQIAATTFGKKVNWIAVGT